MREDFLHYIWKLQAFERVELQTEEGAALHIIQPGQHNHEAGPDFLEAQVQIGGTLWAGSVEIHLKASDWIQHKHSEDAAYDNVILHVVLEADQPIYYASGQAIPTLALRQRIQPGMLRNYWALMRQKTWIPCQFQWPKVDAFHKTLWLERLIVERLEHKTRPLQERLQATHHDWEQVLFEQVARSLGGTQNGDVFECLAQTLSLQLLRKHRDQKLQLEALLFGQAGFLEAELPDAYSQRLAQEFRFLQRKYDLQPFRRSVWRFARMRPGNFPTLRLAQLVALLRRFSYWFSPVLHLKTPKAIENHFAVELEGYWQQHHQFARPSKRRHLHLGKETLRRISINAVVPVMFWYGKYRQEPRFRKQALQLLEQMPAEQNRILRGWAELGTKATDAAQSQALLHLYKNYCSEKRCASCAIGSRLLLQEPV